MSSMVWQPFEMSEARVSHSDVLVRGGDVVTMDAERTVVSDGAVAVRGDRIVAVGTVGRPARCAPRRGGDR